jgi:hypothetical protein
VAVASIDAVEHRCSTGLLHHEPEGGADLVGGREMVVRVAPTVQPAVTTGETG